MHNYTYIHSIGKSGYSNVHTVQHTSGKVFVCKQVRVKNKQTLIKESRILQDLHECPRVPKLIEMVQDRDNIYMIQEQCIGIKLSFKAHSVADTAFVIRNVLIGLWWMHKKSIIHGNIKHDNLVVNAEHVKIVGFGTAKESLDDTVDIWNLGIITYHMLTGEFPNDVDRANVSKVDCPCAKDFLTNCFSCKTKRYDASQCLAHDFVWSDK